eukprot:gene10363-11440_t
MVSNQDKLKASFQHRNAKAALDEVFPSVGDVTGAKSPGQLPRGPSQIYSMRHTAKTDSRVGNIQIAEKNKDEGVGYSSLWTLLDRAKREEESCDEKFIRDNGVEVPFHLLEQLPKPPPGLHALSRESCELRLAKSKSKINGRAVIIYLGIQEQSDGHKTVYAFPKGLEEVLKSAMGEHNYEEEALLFAKVAKIIRQELFNEKGAVFSGIFKNDCQDKLIPSTRLLISMILYGPNANVGALDNIDNNPSSTTAEGSLHGTAISIMQRCRTHADGEERSLKFDLGPFVNEINLPDSFAIVPACSLNPGAIAVPDPMPKKVDDFLPKAIAKEQLWIESASKSLTSENYSNQARS